MEKALTAGGTCPAVGVVLQKLADRLKGLSVVQPPLHTEQTVVIENRIGLLLPSMNPSLNLCIIQPKFLAYLLVS